MASHDVRRRIFGSHSQYLEDLFIDSLFRGKSTGTYIDIGANDPSELSNTKIFYDKGWSGVNVEPSVTMHKRLSQSRSRDINLNIGIGNTSGSMTFYELSPHTLSTFSRESAMHSVEKEGATIISETAVPVMTLAELFRTTLAQRQVDFLSLDAEGYDYEVLSSNDWKSYRPIAVIVELNQDKDRKILRFMINQGYMLVHDNGTNGIFVDESSPEIRSSLQR